MPITPRATRDDCRMQGNTFSDLIVLLCRSIMNLSFTLSSFNTADSMRNGGDVAEDLLGLELAVLPLTPR